MWFDPLAIFRFCCRQVFYPEDVRVLWNDPYVMTSGLTPPLYTTGMCQA